MRTVVLASRNRGKLAELERLLRPLGIELVSAAGAGIDAPEETASTFVENALIKARHAAHVAGKPAIADDSGLVVGALAGAPGIRSARFAGPQASDADNNARLVRLLADVRDRAAFFHCALVYLRTADDPAPLVATASWHGEIVDVPRGRNGFGYDPHFLVPGLGRTSAELEPAEKDERSHRGHAARALRELLRNELTRSA